MPKITDGYMDGYRLGGNHPLFIIKGKIIVPKVKNVVQEYEIE
jgi:hypothetical protein